MMVVALAGVNMKISICNMMNLIFISTRNELARDCDQQGVTRNAHYKIYDHAIAISTLGAKLIKSNLITSGNCGQEGHSLPEFQIYSHAI